MGMIDSLDNYNHRVLTVGDIPDQSRDVGAVLYEMGVEFVHVQTGSQAIHALENAPSPFSLIICDQRLESMEGTELLARAKTMVPETMRFLITRYSDMDIIISAVNKGAAHQCIPMPWQNSQMKKAVGMGLRAYEHHLENERLFALAKRQNTKLYDLTCELMATARQHDIDVKSLERDISQLREQLRHKTAQRPLTPDQLMAILHDSLDETDMDKTQLLDTLYTMGINNLFDTFSDFALRNGLEMPVPKPGDRHD